MLLKRKLEEKDRQIAEKEEVIRVREGQLISKEEVLAEKDVRVRELQNQLEEKTKEMESLGKGDGGEQVRTGLSNLWVQTVLQYRFQLLR